MSQDAAPGRCEPLSPLCLSRSRTFQKRWHPSRKEGTSRTRSGIRGNLAKALGRSEGEAH